MHKPQFIAQESGGDCGAAALAMVLGQFDCNESPQKLSRLLTTIGTNGQPSIKTHQLANYARGLGFSSIVAQFSEPWKVLVNSFEAGFGVIINHRLSKDKPTGHFSVLSQISQADDFVRLHDPQRGPNLRTTRQELLELWSPLVPGSQIAGMVGVIIGPRPVGGVAGVCSSCSQDYDDNTPLKCESCSIILEPLPGFPIGCLSEVCHRKLWRKIFCPNCDRVWSGSNLPLKPMNATAKAGVAPGYEKSLMSDQAIPGEATDNLISNSKVEPEEDLSAQKLAEALKSIPLPDWGAIAALAESQKQTLLELSAFSSISHDLTERAREWDTAADKVRQEASQMEAYRNGLASEIQASADSIKVKTEAAKQLGEIIPEDEQEVPPAEEKPEKPALPSGLELVAMLMSMAKKKG
jgi:hypothetical protein